VKDGGGITARELLDRYAALEDMTRRARARLAEVDVLAVPTVPVTPPTLAEVAALEDHVRINRQIFRNTCPGNLLTLCGLTLPVGLDGAGMPVGLTLLGPAGADERVFAAGAAFESVIGTPRERIGAPPMGPRP
jgi:aspartyl-tRNA(Asn)/glutamyl-tRNA(Gln) amidotransferase subunit A